MYEPIESRASRVGGVWVADLCQERAGRSGVGLVRLKNPSGVVESFEFLIGQSACLGVRPRWRGGFGQWMSGILCRMRAKWVRRRGWWLVAGGALGNLRCGYERFQARDL